MSYKKRINDYLSKCAGTVYDVVYDLYTIIETCDESDQVDAFKYICENIYNIESDNSQIANEKAVTEDQFIVSMERVEVKLNEFINSLAKKCSMDNVDSVEFYTKLWKYIKSTKICKSKRDRVIALSIITKNEFIPYVAVGTGVSMDSEKYSEIIDSFDEIVFNKILYMLENDYEQKTQRYSLLLDEILSQTSKDNQIVLLSLIMGIQKSHLIDKIKNNLDEYI